ncbi:hypothetical protein JCM8208_004842 [Rhodotorula glutinis]
MNTAPSTTTTLLSLPPELVLAILTHLDFASLSHFVLASRSCLALFHAHKNHLARVISIHQGLAHPQTGSAAAPLDHRPSFPTTSCLDDDHDHLDPLELDRVVKSQGWIGVDSLPTWLDYAKRAHSIHRNWLTGTSHSRLVTLDWAAAAPGPAGAGAGLFWRFKVDVDAGYLVVSGLEGGYRAFRVQDGKLAWWSVLPHSPYPHVELSEGFIVQQLSSRTYLASCRTDLVPSTTSASADDRPSALSPSATADSPTTTPLGYAPQHALTTSFPCTASKLRFPILVACAPDGHQLHLWDLSTRSVCTLDTPEFAAQAGNDARVYYVELDGEGNEHADPVQLAVENDRCVFVTHDDELGSALWLINLRTFRDWEDFAREPPEPICLAYPLPTLGPPSRVEMTSSEVFVPALSALLPPSPSSLSPSPSSPSTTLDRNPTPTPTADPPSPLARAFTAMQRAVPRGRSPFSFHWEPLSRTSRTAPVGPRALADPDDLGALGGGLLAGFGGRGGGGGARGERDMWRLRDAWEAVQQAAEEMGVGGEGGSDAFGVWDFAPPVGGVGE